MIQANSKQWLVRRKGSPIVIGGPYWIDQIKEMISRGELDFEDELCMENHYWLALYESEELKVLLGVTELQHPKTVGRKNADQEVTAPDFDVTGPIDQNSIVKGSPSPAQNFERVRASSANFTRGVALVGIDRGRIWLGVLIVSLVASLVGVVWVLKALRL